MTWQLDGFGYFTAGGPFLTKARIKFGSFSTVGHSFVIFPTFLTQSLGPTSFFFYSSRVDLRKLHRLGLFPLPSHCCFLYFLSSYTSHGDSCMELPFLMHLGEKGCYPFLCRCLLLVEKGLSSFSLSTSSVSFFSL